MMETVFGSMSSADAKEVPSRRQGWRPSMHYREELAHLILNVTSVTGAERVRLVRIPQGEQLAGRVAPGENDSLFGRDY